MGAFLCAAGTPVYTHAAKSKPPMRTYPSDLLLCVCVGVCVQGQRFCLPNARFLMQKTGMEEGMRGQATDLAIDVAENYKDNERVNDTQTGRGRAEGGRVEQCPSAMCGWMDV